MRRGFIAVGCFAIFALAGGSLLAAELIERAKLDALAQPLVDDGWVSGLAIGLIGEQGTHVAGYGRVSDRDAAVPTGETVYEIGSITKTFTGLILAQMAEERLVELDEPVQKLLGESMTVPKSEEREITLVDLATHSSGLPRMPGNFRPADPTNPYADYSVEQMAKFISDHKLRRKPGERFEYSNLGVGLLGHALARQEGMSYEALLRKRICDPLKMDDTRIVLDERLKARLAQGHDGDGQSVANWDIPTFAGAGAIRSTAVDMLKYLAANLALTKTPFDEAIAASHAVHFKNSQGPNDLALGWHVRRDTHIIWHNGQTGGYHALAAIQPSKRAGVIVLCSTSSLHVDALGFRVLRLLTGGDAEPLKLAKAIRLDADALEPLLGTYQLVPGVMFTVTREGGQLLAQLTGQQRVKFYPESKTKFFARLMEASLTFEADEDGQIKKLVLHQNGRDQNAPKVNSK